MITTLGRRETSLRLPVIDKMQDIAVDLETRDPDLKTKAPGWVHGNGHICGICISAKEGSFYIPVGHEQGENFDQSVAMKWLQDLMLAPDFDAVFHNAHYDVGWLTQQYGIKITRRIVDTMLAAPLIDEDRFNYGLDALAKDYIRGSKGKDEAILEEEIKKQFEYDYVVDIEKVSIRKKTGGRKSNQELPQHRAARRTAVLSQPRFVPVASAPKRRAILHHAGRGHRFVQLFRAQRLNLRAEQDFINRQAHFFTNISGDDFIIAGQNLNIYF